MSLLARAKNAALSRDASAADAALVAAVLERISAELVAMLGQELRFESPRVERAATRPAGAGSVHISFKLGFHRAGGAQLFGCLLVPLADAIALACHLLMIPEERIAARREESVLEPALKDALLEIGTTLAAAVHTALAGLGLAGWSARSEGCQGVRADVRPAFPYVEGSELVVGRVALCIAPFPASELVLVLPASI